MNSEESMGRYRKIDPRIWNDAKFISLSSIAQLVFMFVLTHPQMTGIGAFRASPEGMAAELNLDAKGFGEPFRELLDKGLVKYDERASLVFAPNFLKYNEPENPNVVQGWIKTLEYLPECPLLVDVLTRAIVSAEKFSNNSKALETVSVMQSLLERLSKEFGEPFPKTCTKGLANQRTENREQRTVITHTSTEVCGASAQTPPPKRSKAVPCPEDVTPESWDAWMLVRKSKRCPMTAHALELTRKECAKVGLTLQQAVDEAVLHSWGGFTAEYHESARRLPNGREITVDRKDRKTIFEIAEELNAKAAAEKAAKKAAQKAAEESPFPA
jgi:hypothetical protein